MARFILITGLIGSGKSEVAKLLRKKHYIVIDSDSEVKKLYEDPVVCWKARTLCGPAVLMDEPPRICPEYLRSRVCDPEEAGVQGFLHYVACRLTESLLDKYHAVNEAIFIEAAPTLQLPDVINRLGIKEVIFVKAFDGVRRDRVAARAGATFSAYELEQFDGAQRKVIADAFYPGFWHGVRELRNNGSLEDLNKGLMEILQHRIYFSDQEKSALYLRYLKESPQYCRENAWCYSFFNLGGCRNCPFPCPRKDIGRERLNKEFMAEKGIQGSV